LCPGRPGQWPCRDLADPFVEYVYRAIKPLLDLNLGTDKTGSAFAEQELVGTALVGNGVIVGNGTLGLGAKYGPEVKALGHGSEPRFGVSRLDAEPLGILGDEGVVEIGGGRLRFGDTSVPELSNKPTLKGTVDAFAPASGLRTVGKDELDCECLHGDFEVCGFVVALEAMDAAVAGSGELTGSIEV